MPSSHKGKERAAQELNSSNKAFGRATALKMQRGGDKQDRRQVAVRSAQGAEGSHKPSSSSSKRQQNLSPQASSSESELDDLELEHESEDEFEQYRNESAPSYAQYQGDSDLDEQDDGGSDDDQSGASENDAGSMQEDGEEEHDYLDDVQADLQQIPLETLIKAQKKLNKLSKPSTSKVAQSKSDETEETSTSTRRGRTEARRGVVANLPNVKEARSKPARPKTRDSKHAPTEVTSKRAVPRFRQVVEVEKTNRRDPRFDALSGELDDSRFRTSYSFIDEARKEEIKRIRYALSVARKRKGAVDTDAIDSMADELQRLQSKQAESERQQRQATVMSEWKHQEKEKRSSGKSEFYLKRGERKKMVESKRMEEVSQDKRKLRKVMQRKDQAEKKKSFKTAPPVRQM